MLAPLRFAGIRRAGVQVPVTAGVSQEYGVRTSKRLRPHLWMPPFSYRKAGAILDRAAISQQTSGESGLFGDF